MTFAYSDHEVYGQYQPVRKDSMRVPDIPPHDWNRLVSERKKIECELYGERCEGRRKEKIRRLRNLMQAKLSTPGAVSLNSLAHSIVQMNAAGKQVEVPRH